MNTRIKTALIMILGTTSAAGVQAALLQTGDVLTITAGTPIYDTYGNSIGVSGGSWFGLDENFSNEISSLERNAIAPGTDGGIVMGTTQSLGAIDSWTYNGALGHHYTDTAPTGGTTAGIDFSGWAVYWNGNTVIPAGSTFDWSPLNCASLGCTGLPPFQAGVAVFDWSGVYGDSYTLWYAASFDVYGSAGFGELMGYMVYLEGTVLAAVPVPAAAWLFGSGLAGLLGVARRKSKL